MSVLFTLMRSSWDRLTQKDLRFEYGFAFVALRLASLFARRRASKYSLLAKLPYLTLQYLGSPNKMPSELGWHFCLVTHFVREPTRAIQIKYDIAMIYKI